MISPAIKPRVAFKPISRGLIVAARNSVNKVQESTQTISKRLNKNEKFAMNYVEFFGSKKTTKILKKNLKSIKESLMSTFAMAKTLRKKVGEMSKGGGIGGLLGGVLGFIGKGLFGAVIGKLLIGTIKGEGKTAIWNLDSKKEVATIKNTTSVSHGIAISSDSKYAFISVEGIGGEPGIVDVISLESYELVSSVEVGKQAGGIASVSYTHLTLPTIYSV